VTVERSGVAALILVRAVINCDWRLRNIEWHDGDLAPLTAAVFRTEVVGTRVYNLYMVADPWLDKTNHRQRMLVGSAYIGGGTEL